MDLVAKLSQSFSGQNNHNGPFQDQKFSYESVTASKNTVRTS